MTTGTETIRAKQRTPAKKLLHLQCVCERPEAVCGKPFADGGSKVVNPPAEDRCMVCQELWLCDNCRGGDL